MPRYGVEEDSSFVPNSVLLLLLTAAFALAGCQSTGMDGANFTRARFFLESVSSDGYSAAVTLPLSRVQIPVESEAIVSEYDYHSIEVVDVDLGRCLAFTLKPPAAREFYQISVANQGKRLVLVVNGAPLGVRKIDGPIANGKIFVFLEVSDKNLEELAKKLKESNFDIQKKLKR
ncbi:hypothetical protein [Pelagicoccus sp. SDUM812002]|uniref:hypothetical protein n=1 Tax=Pelagicoccus sp. SDUM812002 TaxID=3041266 RepID=UPI00280CB646|nr:hypothetical protein [Pelagicoccus sp. SDUM812002]MDQ8185244.1 hypothetical protein [Pelagicoccus sp. SDUM812002]